METESQAKPLSVRISSGTKVLWEGEARFVSSVNSDGPFDVLPLHANLITLVNDKPIQVAQQGGDVMTYTFKQAVLYVNNNTVRIYGDFTENIV